MPKPHPLAEQIVHRDGCPGGEAEVFELDPPTPQPLTPAEAQLRAEQGVQKITVAACTACGARAYDPKPEPGARQSPKLFLAERSLVSSPVR